MSAIRTAIVRGDGTLKGCQDQLKRVKAYLPEDYNAHIALDVRQGDGHMAVWIVGTDYAGWTMDDYVIPRLASGLLFAEEVRR